MSGSASYAPPPDAYARAGGLGVTNLNYGNTADGDSYRRAHEITVKARLFGGRGREKKNVFSQIPLTHFILSILFLHVHVDAADVMTRRSPNLLPTTSALYDCI